MKILLSPAKLMSLETEGNWQKSSTPKFLPESEKVMKKLKTLKSKDLEKLMSISNDLAQMNLERYENWQPKTTKKKSLQAVLAFKGEVYRGLDAQALTENAQDYLNQNLFILSGLYGILKPSDRVMLYRLEMGSKLDVSGSKNLYGFWKETLTDFVNSKLKRKEILLNLASNEYAKVLDDKKLKSPKIDVEFLDFKNGELKPIMVFFKQARGMMARYCAENNVSTLEELKLFNENNYAFDTKLSTGNKLVFTR
ncbi:MAG TPA: peroxide stress protein YaaA [Moheibacter sp.]|nr:peroxide stress protein YaaA [Moheibacter sp.]